MRISDWSSDVVLFRSNRLVLHARKGPTLMADIRLQDLGAAAELLRALAHELRLELLRALTDGERSVGEIEKITGLTQPGLSQQLGILRKAEIGRASWRDRVCQSG